MSDFLQDLRYGFRTLRKSPGFTAAALAALALAIGANTAIFSVVNAVLLRALPFPEPDRLVMLYQKDGPRDLDRMPVARGAFLLWQRGIRSFSAIGAIQEGRVNLSAPGEPQQVNVQQVNAGFFNVLGVAPAIGRPFTEAEARQGGPEVALISHGLWLRRFGGQPDVLGKRMVLGGRATEIIGVMPQSYRTPEGNPDARADMWIPIRLNEVINDMAFPGHNLTVIARLAKGTTLETARAELNTVAARIAKDHPRFNEGWTAQMFPLHDELSGGLRRPVLVLFGAVALVLLIACANVANLMLARSAGRQREMAIRGSLGAPRWRLVRQLLTESLVLSLLAGVAGVLLAVWGVDMLVRLAPAELRLRGDVSVDGRVLAFNFAVAVATGLLFGMAPALTSTRSASNSALRRGTRSSHGTLAARLRTALVIGEVARGVVLLAGAGLLMRSFLKLQAIDPGFRTSNVYAARVQLPPTEYKTPEQRAAFFAQAIERAAALPGVERTGLAALIPYGGAYAATGLRLLDRPAPPRGQEPIVDGNAVSGGFFAAVDIPLLAGRVFDQRDSGGAPRVIVVNEAFAKTHYPGRSPVGRKVQVMMFDDSPVEIVGVVGNIRQNDLTQEPRPAVFFPHAQTPFGLGAIMVRSSLPPSALASGVAGAIRSLDRSLPAPPLEPLDRLVADSIARSRFLTLLLATFAGCALLLAAIGLYGLISYGVAQRTQEIGVRMALGAAARDILAMVVGGGFRTVGAGLVLGLAGAFGLSRWVRSLLYETPAHDPLTYATISVILVTVAAVAAWVPARRATQVQPVEALRYE